LRGALLAAASNPSLALRASSSFCSCSQRKLNAPVEAGDSWLITSVPLMRMTGAEAAAHGSTTAFRPQPPFADVGLPAHAARDYASPAPSSSPFGFGGGGAGGVVSPRQAALTAYLMEHRAAERAPGDRFYAADGGGGLWAAAPMADGACAPLAARLRAPPAVANDPPLFFSSTRHAASPQPASLSSPATAGTATLSQAGAIEARSRAAAGAAAAAAAAAADAEIARLNAALAAARRAAARQASEIALMADTVRDLLAERRARDAAAAAAAGEAAAAAAAAPPPAPAPAADAAPPPPPRAGAAAVSAHIAAVRAAAGKLAECGAVALAAAVAAALERGGTEALRQALRAEAAAPAGAEAAAAAAVEPAPAPAPAPSPQDARGARPSLLPAGFIHVLEPSVAAEPRFDGGRKIPSPPPRYMVPRLSHAAGGGGGDGDDDPALLRGPSERAAELASCL
jgi:hypothetical protein